MNQNKSFDFGLRTSDFGLLFRLLASVFTFFIIFNFHTTIHATLSLTTQTAVRSKVPQSSSKAALQYFSLSATVVAETVSKITITNTSPTVTFGKGVSMIYIYKDDGDQIFDESKDTKLVESSAGQNTSVQLTISTTIPQDTTYGYFVVYNISSTAEIGATTNIQLTNFTHNSAAVYTPAANSQTITITGLSMQTVTATAPTIVIPGQENIQMLHIALKMVGENLKMITENATDVLKFTVKNAQNNFSNTAESTTGVVKLSLYKDTNNNQILDTTPLAIIEGTSFISTSEAEFTKLRSLEFQDGVTMNLYVLYELGEDIPITTESKINAQLTAFTGIGADSKLAVSIANTMPVDPAVSSVAGLSYASLESIVPATNAFGPGTDVPILKFKLKANSISVTLNQVTIKNTGTIKYITNKTDTSGVTNIKICEDTNQDYEYNGDGFGDTLIGQLQLGNGAGQSKESAPIPIQYTNNKIGFVIPTSNKDDDQSKMFFVIYHLGEGITVSTSTANTNGSATALLEDAQGSTNVSTSAIKLSGTLPSSATPSAAEVTVQKINIRSTEILSAVPPYAVRGQTKVPMLYLKLRNEEATKDTIFQILNNNASFLDNNTGVSKIWIYRDDNQDAVLDKSDTLLSSLSLSETGAIISPLRVNMPKFDLPRGNNNLFICYDIGQEAILSTSNIMCQLENITSTGSTLINFGGERPLPAVPATVTINAAFLSVDAIYSSTSNITNQTPTFTVQIQLSNTSAQAVELTDITPRFYLNTQSGMDVTYEFNMDLKSHSLPLSIPAGDTIILRYDVAPDELRSTGSIFMDSTAEYKISSGNVALISRYKASGSTWKLSTTQYAQASIYSNLEDYNFLTPDYISDLKFEYGGQKTSYRSFDAIPANSNLIVYFKDKGKYINEAKFQVTFNVLLNNTPLTLTNANALERTTPYYEYNKNEGTLTIYNLGKVDGTLEISVSDLNGNILKNSSKIFSFYISQTIQIYKFLCYPNPYRIPATLKFGFSITQPASDIRLYLFDSNGQKVWDYQTTKTSIGYQEIEWDGKVNGFYLGAGIYIAKIVTIDPNGKKATAWTKLAVY